MKAVGTLIVLFLVFGIVGGVIWFLGSANPVTPAGYVGYLTRGAIFGKTEFVGLQTGPVSPGRGWLLDVVNVSVTPYTYTEPFVNKDGVLAKDNLLLQFQAHIVFKIRADRMREFIEKYSTTDTKIKPDQVVEIAYKNYLKEPFRTYVRDQVQILNGLAVKDNITKIGSQILEETRTLSKDTPFDILSVVVGNIQYPDAVANAVSTKLATTQLWEQKQTEIEIEKRDAEKRVIQARGIADSMDIINQKLTPTYLQHEAIEAQKAMVGSQNHTTVYIPVGPMGVPLTGTFSVEGVQPKGK